MGVLKEAMISIKKTAKKLGLTTHKLEVIKTNRNKNIYIYLLRI